MDGRTDGLSDGLDRDRTHLTDSLRTDGCYGLDSDQIFFRTLVSDQTFDGSLQTFCCIDLKDVFRTDGSFLIHAGSEFLFGLYGRNNVRTYILSGWRTDWRTDLDVRTYQTDGRTVSNGRTDFFTDVTFHTDVYGRTDMFIVTDRALSYFFGRIYSVFDGRTDGICFTDLRTDGLTLWTN